MFMISSSTALAATTAVVLALSSVVDSQSRLRLDRVYSKPALLWRVRDGIIKSIVDGVKGVFYRVFGRRKQPAVGERQALLQ